MSVLIACPQCEARGVVPDEYEGETVQCPECGRAFVAQKTGSMTDWHVGEVLLDQYDVTGLLGEGGMGRVYKVHHRNWNMDLAVKRPRADFIERSGGTKEFECEAETWVKLGLHPHIVSCYYVRNIGEIPCVFAEYVEGGSLDDWIRNGRLYEGGPDEALKRILDISIQFAWGLQYAHGQGLIHQDIKPANVMMTQDGSAKVTDFGLSSAKGMHWSDQMDSGDSILVTTGGCTPAYASPEQLHGQKLTRRTDIWSFGLSILEMFTGMVTWRIGAAAPVALEIYLKHGSVSEHIQQSDNPKGLLAGSLLRQQEAFRSLPRMPQTLYRLLQDCFMPDAHDRPESMENIGELLEDIYRQEVKEIYCRSQPSQVRETAGSLNNWAMSLLDLRQQEDAMLLWDKALRIQPHHSESTYNRGLLLWRTSQITDKDLILAVKEACKSHSFSWVDCYLLALVHLERGDFFSAIQSIKNLNAEDLQRREIKTLLSITHGQQYFSIKLCLTVDDSSGDISCANLSGNAQKLVTGNDDGSLKIWAKNSGNLLHIIKGKSNSGKSLFRRLKKLTFLQRQSEIEDGSSSISSVFVSQEGTFALSSGFDDSIKLWDLVSGYCKYTLTGRGNEIEAVCISDYGEYILLAEGPKLKLLDTDSCRCIQTMEGHTDLIRSVAISADGRYGMSLSFYEAKLWDFTRGVCLKTIPGFDIHSIALSSKGDMALTASNKIVMWDRKTACKIQSFEGHKLKVSSINISHDCRYILTSTENEAKFWDVSSSCCLYSFCENEMPVLFSPDCRYLLSGSWGGTLKLWVIPSMRCLRTFDEQGGAVAFSDNGRFALSGSQDSLHLYEIGSQPLHYVAPLMVSRAWESSSLLSIQAQYVKYLSTAKVALGEKNFQKAAAFAQSARNLPGFERAPEALEIWTKLYQHLPRKALMGGWEELTFSGHTDRVTSICLTEDKYYAISGSWDDSIRVWDILSGKCIRVIKGHASWVTSICLHPNGKTLISASRDSFLKSWEIQSGKCLATFKGHKDIVYCLYLTSDGRYAISGGSDGAKLWDVASGKCLQSIEVLDKPIRSAFVNSDLNFILMVSNKGTLEAWEGESVKSRKVAWNKERQVLSVMDNGESLYVLSRYNSDVILWNILEDHRTYTLTGMKGNPVYLSSEGNNIIVANERDVEIWDVTSGKMLRSFSGHQGQVTSGAMSSDGKHILSGSDDGEIKLWVLDWSL
jgi:WD40 repeat protein